MSRSYLTVFAFWFLTTMLAEAAAIPQAVDGATSNEAPQKPAMVQAVGMAPGEDGPALEIITSKALVPAIQQIDGPRRLVIDLRGAILAVRRNRLDFRDDSIAAIRIDQYKNSPPITRIVIDLRRPVGYTWDGAGNRLMIRLHPGTSQAGSGAAASLRSAALADNGQVLLANNRLAPGSSVTAGSDAAVLDVGGGQVRVCPGTTVSVTSSANGRELLLGLSTGALETHYSSRLSADSVLTPDFRVLLSGPGESDYAISADARGNTCVRSLSGSQSPALVFELIGDGSYAVRAGEQAMFHSGRLRERDQAVPADCGCPSRQPPLLVADETGPSHSVDSLATSSQSALTAPLPPSQPNEVHIQVDAPMVFRASDPPLSSAAAAPLFEVKQMPIRASMAPAFAATLVISPPSNAKLHRGLFGRVKGFFSTIFTED